MNAQRRSWSGVGRCGTAWAAVALTAALWAAPAKESASKTSAAPPLPEVLYDSEAPVAALPPAVHLAGLPTGIPKGMPLTLAIPAAAPIAPPATPSQAEVTSLLTNLGQEAARRSPFEARLIEQLRAAMPEGSEGYLFDRVTVPDLAALPEGGDAQFVFHLPTTGIGTATWTATILTATGQPTRRVSGSVWIDREAQGLQVNRVVRRGEALRREDVVSLGTRLSQLPRGALDQIDTTNGTVARNELRPGQWLTDQVVATPDLVKRGQALTIRLDRGRIQITVPGMAQQAGPMGAVIRVQNLQSQREIMARIVSKDVVEVIF